MILSLTHVRHSFVVIAEPGDVFLQDTNLY